ncbi:flagellin [Pacificimonas flava]|uniref:Flagellin n=2 Tax=Pacificimonas TaxID=1960290 RepID=A0A219B630_9SPHN|nr:MULTISPECIES: flagellin [Pacificimonas]MBZ6379218.1 flagellin [Pacificimonas aurantium]OWV33566.1 flagellin [Pacificimonas flava]
MRIATMPLQLTMSDAIQRTQGRLADIQSQLSTGKKAPNLAALGNETVRNMSAHSMVSRQEAELQVAQRLQTTMSLYDAHITQMDDVTSGLKNDLLTAIGTGRAEGLQAAIESAFDQLRGSLNTSEGDVYLFGGSQTDKTPFLPEKVQDLAGLPDADVFANDDVKAKARVAEGVDITYGVLASDVAGKLTSALRTLAEAGHIGATPTEAQKTALQTAVGQIDDALADIRSSNAANGRRQLQADQLTERTEDRILVLKSVIAENEDADLAQVAVDLAQQQARLEASYQVFARLSSLSLGDYLR